MSNPSSAGMGHGGAVLLGKHPAMDAAMQFHRQRQIEDQRQANIDRRMRDQQREKQVNEILGKSLDLPYWLEHEKYGPEVREKASALREYVIGNAQNLGDPDVRIKAMQMASELKYTSDLSVNEKKRAFAALEAAKQSPHLYSDDWYDRIVRVANGEDVTEKPDNWDLPDKGPQAIDIAEEWFKKHGNDYLSKEITGVRGIGMGQGAASLQYDYTAMRNSMLNHISQNPYWMRTSIEQYKDVNPGMEIENFVDDFIASKRRIEEQKFAIPRPTRLPPPKGGLTEQDIAAARGVKDAWAETQATGDIDAALNLVRGLGFVGEVKDGVAQFYKMAEDKEGRRSKTNLVEIRLDEPADAFYDFVAKQNPAIKLEAISRQPSPETMPAIDKTEAYAEVDSALTDAADKGKTESVKQRLEKIPGVKAEVVSGYVRYVTVGSVKYDLTKKRASDEANAAIKKEVDKQLRKDASSVKTSDPLGLF